MKIAKERGLIDTRKKPRGGDRMKIEKGNTGSDNISVAFVEERKLTKLKIINEGEMNTYTPKEGSGDKPTTRLLIGISYEGQQDGDPKHWRMNNTSRNALIDIYGDDTEKWIGKEPEITLEGTGEFRHITIDTLRTK